MSSDEPGCSNNKNRSAPELAQVDLIFLASLCKKARRLDVSSVHSCIKSAV